MRPDPTLAQLTDWALGRQEVRALILTSSRAVPGAELDAYSDYDVVLVLEEVRPMLDQTSWLSDFGEVLVAYWDPLKVETSTGAEHVTCVVNYTDGLKIDFSLLSRRYYDHVTAGPAPDPELDAGYQVLVDKDRLTADLPEPTFTSYIPERPDEQTFQRLVTDFLIGVPYVAKSLLRAELLPARWVLDYDMRFNYFIPMLQWRVQCDHAWSLKMSNLGKGLEAHLPADVWSEVVDTFADADPERTWEALFAMINLFERTADEVSRALGYPSPVPLVARVRKHAQRMRDGLYANGRMTEPSDDVL